MAAYNLPDLEYDYGALEPHVSADIMKLHHDKHHKAYVDNANATLEKLAAAREKMDFTTVAALERALAFNVSGHVMHSVFWKNMKPKQVNQIYDHQSNYNVGSTPIMVIDGWEHAWYLQYKNVKAEFFKALWNVWNWDDVAKRFAAARG
jgi:Fe-Mn family superoxide dismutase